MSPSLKPVFSMASTTAVSYTHLDVCKRQMLSLAEVVGEVAGNKPDSMAKGRTPAKILPQVCVVDTLPFPTTTCTKR